MNTFNSSALKHSLPRTSNGLLRTDVYHPRLLASTFSNRLGQEQKSG